MKLLCWQFLHPCLRRFPCSRTAVNRGSPTQPMPIVCHHISPPDHIYRPRQRTALCPVWWHLTNEWTISTTSLRRGTLPLWMTMQTCLVTYKNGWSSVSKVLMASPWQRFRPWRRRWPTCHTTPSKYTERSQTIQVSLILWCLVISIRRHVGVAFAKHRVSDIYLHGSSQTCTVNTYVCVWVLMENIPCTFIREENGFWKADVDKCFGC